MPLFIAQGQLHLCELQVLPRSGQEGRERCPLHVNVTHLCGFVKTWGKEL